MSTNTKAILIPTWYDDIRYLFTAGDIACMKNHGYDLSNYDTVKNGSGGIYGQVSGGMMPKGGPAWPEENVVTFYNWINTGYTKGPRAVATSNIKSLSVAPSKATRIRKEISTLSSEEITTLKKAFAGIMAKDPITDPNSYYAQAGVHGFPNPNCMHHTPGYNPWHRVYLWHFENALRTVEGCENVVLPYWDFSTLLPDVFNQAPLNSYTLPIDTTYNGTKYRKGMVTSRYSAAQIASNLQENQTLEWFQNAAKATDWEDYHGLLGGSTNDATFMGHDTGHMSIGESMGNQDVAAFDPIFWFYHCNLDRMFWEWQSAMKATNQDSILTTIQTQASRNIFTVPAYEELPPFKEISPGVVDSENNLDVDYAAPSKLIKMNMNIKSKGSSLASDKFTVNTEMANVRVKGFNRLKIPGSFKIHLLKDGIKLASRGFFQPNEVEKCANCVENAIVHFDFKLPLSELSNGQLSISVEPSKTPGELFPLSKLGNPTINVRLLLNNA